VQNPLKFKEKNTQLFKNYIIGYAQKMLINFNDPNKDQLYTWYDFIKGKSINMKGSLNAITHSWNYRNPQTEISWVQKINKRDFKS
jgi:hypothetical protein